MAGVAACAGITGPGSLAEDRVLVEIEYVNFAWTPQFFGFYIDGDGDVFRYDRKGKTWSSALETSISAQEMEEKVGLNRVAAGARPETEARAVAAKIDAVPPTALSAPKMRCADAGTLTYRAYKYNSSTKRYTPILLRVQGDIAQHNTSPEAQELIAYIRSLGLIQELLDCGP